MMRIQDTLKLATRMFRTRPTRTWLTIAGIGVGIAAVVILVGLGYGLQGLLQVGIKNFNFAIDDAWQESSAYAYLQLGLADTMHILIAEHLGCAYFASFDADFLRIKEILTEETGITLLTKPEEILEIL